MNTIFKFLESAKLGYFFLQRQAFKAKNQYFNQNVKARLLITIAFLLFYTINTSNARATDTLATKRLIIKASSFEYLPSLLKTGNINLGAEIYLKNRKSVYANFGVIWPYNFNFYLWDWYSADNYKGWKLQVEGRHYLNKHKIFEPAILLFWPHLLQFNSEELPNTGYYVGLHSSQRFLTSNRTENVIVYNENVPFPNNAQPRLVSYTLNSTLYGLNLKFGYQAIKKYGFTVDYAVGIGCLFISNTLVNKVGDVPELSRLNYPNLPAYFFGKETGFSPNLMFQLKLGSALDFR